MMGIGRVGCRKNDQQSLAVQRPVVASNKALRDDRIVDVGPFSNHPGDTGFETCRSVDRQCHDFVFVPIEQLTPPL